MKILHIIDSGGLYGAEIMLLNLIEEQIKLGLEPTICSIGEPNIPENLLETEALERDFNLKKIRMRNGPNIIGALKILLFAHQECFDLIHSHGYKSNILLGFIPKRIRKLPILSTLHGWTCSGSFSKLKIYEWFDAKSLKFVDAVVLVNNAMLSNPKIKKKNIKRLSIIYNGLPFSDSHAFNSKSLKPVIDSNNLMEIKIVNFCGEGFIVGAIGRLSDEKGFDYLIEAFYLLRQKNSDSKLIIIGEGSNRKGLEKKIDDLNLTDKVFLPGYIKNAQRFLPYLKVFVLSSLTEGLPITILEAMRAKIPIIATKVGGIPEVLQNGLGGLIVDPKDPISLADAINYIHDNQYISKRLVDFSYNEVITKYTIKNMTLKYLNVYQEIINAFSRN